MKPMLSPVLMLVLADAEKGALWYFKQMDTAGLAVAVAVAGEQALEHVAL